MAEQVSNITTETEQIDFEDMSSLINLSRNDRAMIAEDTLNKLDIGYYCPSKSSKISLQKDITYSMDNSILYTEDDFQNTKKLVLTIDETETTSFTSTNSTANIEIRHCTTLQAARSLVSEIGEDGVGVLNFASAKNPGGGFRKGSHAQEESIARSSSLYPALTQSRFLHEYYDYNRRGKNCIYSHRIIYSPRITIFKDDNGNLLSSPYHVGIVTVPAPNASVVRDVEAVRNAMIERTKRLLHVFAINNYDSLVLGAFGCGVFKNNPFDVATIFRQHLESKEFKNVFKRIIFAITDDEMCQIFKQVFSASDFNHIQQKVGKISLNNDNKQHPRNNRNKHHKNVAKQNRRQNNNFEQVNNEKYSNYKDNDEINDIVVFSDT